MAITPEHIMQNMPHVAYQGPLCEGVEFIAEALAPDEKAGTKIRDTLHLRVMGIRNKRTVEVLIDDRWSTTARVRELRMGRFGSFAITDFDSEPVEKILNGVFEKVQTQMPQGSWDRIKRRFMERANKLQSQKVELQGSI